MTPDVNTLEVDLPTTLPGYSVANSDNTFTIVLNAKLTFERRMQTYQHEMDHIVRGDYDRKNDVDIIEFFAHGL